MITRIDAGNQLSRFFHVSLEADYHYQKIGTTRNVTSKHTGQYFAYQIHTSHRLDRLNLEAGGVSYKKHGVAIFFQWSLNADLDGTTFAYNCRMRFLERALFASCKKSHTTLVTQHCLYLQLL